MQIFVLTVLLLASSRGISSGVSVSQDRLPAPQNIETIAFDLLGIIIKWELVHSELEPVLGYKVRLWEGQETKTYVFKTIDNKKVLVEEIVKPQLIDLSPHNSKEHEYVIRGADHSQLIINHIKLDTPYLYQILAFGASGDGEPSSYVRLQFSNANTTMY